MQPQPCLCLQQNPQQQSGPRPAQSLAGQAPAGAVQPCPTCGHYVAACWPEPEQLITLDQVAAMVHRRKRTMRNYLREMPPPRVKGVGGMASLWAWSDVRDWLAERFNMPWLPERFPYGPH